LVVDGGLVEVALEVQRGLRIERGMESGWVIEGVYVIAGEELELIGGGDGFVGRASVLKVAQKDSMKALS